MAPLDIPLALVLAGSAAALCVACGSSETAPQPSSAAPAAAEQSAQTDAVGEPPEPPTEEPGASCADRAEQAAAAVEATVQAHGECTFDVDCVQASRETGCAHPCEVALQPAGLDALTRALAAAEQGCASFEADGCSRAEAECARATPRCAGGRCAMDEGDPPLREVPIPDANRAGQTPPPPRPPPGDAEQARAARLLRAIAEDDPRLAQDFFFPREAFRRVKAIGDPDGYWRQLFERYAADIHALHEQLEREAPGEGEPELVSLDIIRRGGWVPRGEEANALPYWVSRHSRLRYRVGDQERSLEVRVLITWGERWYVTHLSEFH